MTAGQPMAGEDTSVATLPHVHCELEGIPGWHRYEAQGLTLWFKGYLNGDGAEGLARRLAALPCEEWEQVVVAIDGHFALAVARGDEALAAVDRIASIPLLYGFDGTAWRVDGNARRLAIIVLPFSALIFFIFAPLRKTSQRLLACAWTTSRTGTLPDFLKL